MKKPFLCVLLVGVLGIPTILSAQIKLTRIDGTSFDAASAVLQDGMLKSGETEVDWNELRRLEFGREVKQVKAAATIQLAGGGTLGATKVKLADDQVILENVAGEISLGVEAVTSIRFKSEELPLYAQAKPKEELDQLFVKIEGNYQTVPGIVNSIDESKVSFLYDEDEIEFKTEDVYGLILAQGFGGEDLEVNGVIVLTEGSRLNCEVQGITAERVTAAIAGLAEVVIPIKVVSKIEIKSNRLAFLSDLTPASVDYLEGAVFTRSWQKDRNIAGGKLVLRDREKRESREYVKGLGTKSGMKLVYQNNGFDRMVAMLGIDASTNGNGICNVKVLGDGKELLAAEITGLDSPRPVDLDISGVDEVELVIEFGKDFLDLSDHVNWCDARFVKKSN